MSGKSAQQPEVPRRAAGGTFQDAVGFAARLLAAVAIAVLLYGGVQVLGRQAGVSLVGVHLDLAVPSLIFAALIALLLLPLFGGWRGGVRGMATMVAISLLVLAGCLRLGLFKFDPGAIVGHALGTASASAVVQMDAGMGGYERLKARVQVL